MEKIYKVKVSQKHTPTAEEKKAKKIKKATIRKMNMSSINLAKYLKEHELDPDKDWRKDPDHGPTINKFLKEIQEAKMKLTPALKEKPINKVKEKDPKKTNTYDYPEGLDRAQKKRFRFKMRRLLRANADISEATKKALAYAVNGELLKDKRIQSLPTKTDIKKLKTEFEKKKEKKGKEVERYNSSNNTKRIQKNVIKKSKEAEKKEEPKKKKKKVVKK